MSGPSPFSATAAALGYVYQFRYSLARALEGIRSGSYEWSIAIEAADDIEVIAGSSRELRQLKQVGRPLTNSSGDLWKSIRVWATGINSGLIDPEVTQFYLVTTAAAPAGSIASLLGASPEDRDESAALAKLLEVCNASGSEDNKKSYKAFLEMTDNQRASMLRAIIVLQESTNTSGLRDELSDAIRVGMRRDYLDAMVERLEGWWFNKCISCLVDTKDRITAEQLDSFVAELREQFHPDNLPIDHDIAGHLEPEVEPFAGHNFVGQVRLAEVSDRRIKYAVRDYLRAYAQRSRWARLNLMQPDELENYERILREEWELIFAQACDELGSDAAEAEKVRVARTIYAWVESAAVPPIRSMCTEGFVKRGSYHILAESNQVGWHPDFLERLSRILEPVAGA